MAGLKNDGKLISNFQLVYYNYRAIVEIYASITISAWEKSEDEIVRSAIETDIIQDLMYTTIHIQRGGPKSLNSLLMNVSYNLYLPMHGR